VHQSGHRGKRALTKAATRIALVLGALVFLGGFADFGYHAQLQAMCSDTNSDLLTSDRWISPGPADCVDPTLDIAEHFRFDVMVALSGLALVVFAAIIQSKMHRRAKRAWLMLESAVVTVTLAYVTLVIVSTR
jgi:hypothetical protein